MMDNKKVLRAGIIGCGNIFPMHAHSVGALENGRVAAVCDIDRGRADKAAKELNCKAFYDYKEMIDSGEIDVVHVCTPHYLHKEMVLYALKKDLFVICEKPMAIRMEDGEEMACAAKESKGGLSIIFQNRLNPGSVFAKQVIDSGKLGKILGGKIIVTWNRPESYYASGDWRGTLDKEGGGVIINQAIHSFDLLRWLIPNEFVSVQASIANRIHPSIAVEDEASGLLQFEGGLHVPFFATNNFSMDDPILVMIHGEKGVMRIVSDEATVTYGDGTTERSGTDDEKKIDFGDGAKGYWGISHYKQIRNEYNAFLAGQPDDTLEEGIKTHRMICALYESARKNK